MIGASLRLSALSAFTLQYVDWTYLVLLTDLKSALGCPLGIFVGGEVGALVGVKVGNFVGGGVGRSVGLSKTR